jgi:hypothetical protein
VIRGSDWDGSVRSGSQSRPPQTASSPPAATTPSGSTSGAAPGRTSAQQPGQEVSAIRFTGQGRDQPKHPQGTQTRFDLAQVWA